MVNISLTINYIVNVYIVSNKILYIYKYMYT